MSARALGVTPAPELGKEGGMNPARVQLVAIPGLAQERT
jgi:hypothetical protein